MVLVALFIKFITKGKHKNSKTKKCRKNCKHFKKISWLFIDAQKIFSKNAYPLVWLHVEHSKIVFGTVKLSPSHKNVIFRSTSLSITFYVNAFFQHLLVVVIEEKIKHFIRNAPHKYVYSYFDYYALNSVWVYSEAVISKNSQCNIFDKISDFFQNTFQWFNDLIKSR